MNTVTMTGCELDKIIKFIYTLNHCIPLVDIPRVVDPAYIIDLQIKREGRESVFDIDSKKEDIRHIVLEKLAKIDLKQYDHYEISTNNNDIIIMQKRRDLVKDLYKSTYPSCEELATRKTYISTSLHDYYGIDIMKSALYKIVSTMKKISKSPGCSIKFIAEKDINLVSSYKELDVSYDTLITGSQSACEVKSTADMDILLNVLKIIDDQVRLSLKTDYPLRLEWMYGSYRFGALVALRIEPDD